MAGYVVRLRQVVERVGVVREPLLVGALGAKLGLDLLVGDQPAALSIEHEHAARLDARLVDDVLVGDIEHAGLGGHDEQVVAGHEEAAGPETVAVEDRAYAGTVGTDHEGGAVPRLHEGGMVLVEGLLLLAHGDVVCPRLGDHHHHRVRQRASGGQKQLKDVVEGRGVALVGRGDDWQQLADVIAEDIGLQHGVTGGHPVDVAAQGVDLAVMDDVAIGVREPPRAERVRAEARMHHREAGLDVRVGEVEVEALKLAGEDESLVYDLVRGEAGDVGVQSLVSGAVFDLASEDVEAELEGGGFPRTRE